MLKVYPNPASNIVLIEVGEIQNYNILFYDIDGQLLDVTNNNLLDVSSFHNGTYLLKLTDDTGKVLEIKKIVISK